MSDSSNITKVVDGETLIIYNNRKPDSYAEADIFDPDNPSSGKYFPSLNSIVIKTDGTLWYVSARNEETFKVTLSPCSIFTSTIEDTTTDIISYGNDKFCLYIDKRVSPYKLIVDAKLLFYGISIKEYTLSRVNSSGKEEIISIYLDNLDRFISDRIPMSAIAENVNAYKFPTNCHTTADLAEGEPITLTAYNTLGNVCAKIILYVRNAIWLNDLNSLTNPIVNLDADCLQERGDEWFIYERQDPSHLNIRPYLTYSDGSKEYVNIDNMKCFLFGFDDFLPSYPGYSQTIVIKYFLGPNDTTTAATKPKFLTVSKKLTVVKQEEEFSGKLVCVPTFSKTDIVWELQFFLYSDKRDRCYNATEFCRINSEYPFDGSPDKYGTEQHIVVDYDMARILGLEEGIEIPGSQSFYITVWNPNLYEKFTIRDSKDSTITYGADGSVVRRPVIHYDETEDVFYIPTSIFRNAEAVIESFYLKATPFFDTRTETEPPTPTHFVLREPASGSQINAYPIALTEYGTAMHRLSTATSTYVDSTILVEFLQYVNGQYSLLFGVPVDVCAGIFNDENSD